MTSANERTITPAVFASAVGDTLARLLLQHGFTHVSSADYLEGFQRGPVSVIARYGGYREGIAVSIGYDDDERPLELADALRVTDCPDVDVRRVEQMMTVDADVLGRLLAGCAELLGKHATSFLDGDRSATARAYAERSARSAEFTRKTAVSSLTIEKADAAWQERDYASVRNLLAPARQHLDRTHLRRLDFAQRRVDDGT